MRIAISGTNSSIGRAVVREFSSQGIEIVYLNRTGQGEIFNLAMPIELKLGHIDAFVHLAWDWEKTYLGSYRRNVENILPLLDSLKSNKTKLVLLSTESASGSPGSNYGKVKLKLEQEFSKRGGSSIRAGLLWGSEMSGIVATICKLSTLSFVCPHLKPDPAFFVSNEEEIARELLTQALSVSTSPIVVSLKSRNQIKLSDISHAFQGSKLKVLHLDLGVKNIIAIGDLLMTLRIPLPFRVDSLRSLLVMKDPSQESASVEKCTVSSTQDFLKWVSKFRR